MFRILAARKHFQSDTIRSSVLVWLPCGWVNLSLKPWTFRAMSLERMTSYGEG